MGFFDGGSKGASYNEEQGFPLGTTWSGVIVNVGEERQAMSYVEPGSGAVSQPLTYPKSGDPIMELPIEIKADQVTASAEDDGIRVIFFEGEKKKALIVALRAAGTRRDPHEGDWISLQWTGRGGPTGRRKLFTAQFRPDVAPPAAGQFFGQPQAAAVPAQQVAPQAAAQPQSAGRPPWADAAPAPVGAPASGNGAW